MFCSTYFIMRLGSGLKQNPRLWEKLSTKVCQNFVLFYVLDEKLKTLEQHTAKKTSWKFLYQLRICMKFMQQNKVSGIQKKHCPRNIEYLETLEKEEEEINLWNQIQLDMKYVG